MGLVFCVSPVGAQTVSALSAPTFKWQTFTLPASSTIARGSVWTSNSTGALSWKAFGGGCERRGENIVTYASGICKVRVWYTASKIHSAIDTERPHTVVPKSTVAPAPAPAPPITPAPKPTVAPAPPITPSPKPTIAPAPKPTIAPVKPSCALGGVCKLGDIGPGGGTVFYVASKFFESSKSVCGTKCKYLEVSRHAGTMGWCDAGLSATSVGKTEVKIGSGMANTEFAVSKNNGDKKCRTGAIKRAYDYTSNGKRDWFLPSINELIELNRFILIVLGADRQKGGMLLNERGIQYLGTDVVFWSSSEIDRRFVWVEYLGLTYERKWQKNESGNPFAIFARAF